MVDWILLPGTSAMNFAQQAPEAMLRDAVAAVGEFPEPALAAVTSGHARSVPRREWRARLQSNTNSLQHVGSFPDILSGVCEFAPLVLLYCPALCTVWICSTGMRETPVVSSTDPTSTRRDDPPHHYSLWCPRCGRTDVVGIEAMHAFGEIGWPECCSRVMFCGPTTSMPGKPDGSSSSQRGAPSEAT